MSEEQADYNVEQDAKEALEMLGKGYDREAPYEIHLPAHVLCDNGSGLQEYETGTWIKLSTSFRNVMSKLKGSRLSVFLCICLHINGDNNCYPSLETLAEESGYSRREVVNAVQELEATGFLTVRRGEMKSNLYHVNVAAAYGAESALVHFSTSTSAVSAKNTRQSALKEEPIKKNQNKKRGDILDGILDFHLSPKAIQDAIRDFFKLTPNWRAISRMEATSDLSKSADRLVESVRVFKLPTTTRAA